MFVTHGIRSVSIVDDDLGYKAIQPGVAAFCTDSIYGNRCIRVDSSVFGNWKKTSFPTLQHNHVASSTLGKRSWELLPTLDCSLFARVG
jgi:hypothetical protein